MQSHFSTKVTAKTIKKDSAIARLNPISEAIKNAIDAKASEINIYIYAHNTNRDLINKDISIIIEDNGSGFDCSNSTYMQNRWTHYKGGDYIPNTLGGRSKGRYSYLKFIDFKEECLKNIKIFTKCNKKSFCVTFCSNDKNVSFNVTQKSAKYKKDSITQVNIERLGEQFISGKKINELIDSIKQEIAVEFSDKLLNNVTLCINNEKIEVQEYIEEQLEKEYELKDGSKFKAYIIVWKNEINLIADKKHTFLLNEKNNLLWKIPSGSSKSIFNCHTIFLTSDIFKDDCELIDLNAEYKKTIQEVMDLYKPDLDRMLCEVWLKNADLVADKLANENEIFKKDADNMIKEKINEAYKILSLPLLIKEHNITRNIEYFSNSLMGLISNNAYNTLENLNFVFKLSDDEKEIFNYVRRNINILDLVKQYHNFISRLDVLHHFENLVLNEGKNTTKERSELHKIVENNLWLFNEDYLDLEFFSDQALKGIFKDVGLPIQSNDNLNTIPDIFIPRTKDNKLILIELKAPKVSIDSKILNEVFNKYIIKILNALQTQGSNINFIEAICVSSTKQRHIGTLQSSEYTIKAMTWKEIINTRKAEINTNINNTKHNLSLSKYKDINHFKEKEIQKDRVGNLKRL
ncbi:hypothetical protein DCO58_04155 [Helicobacter saguini]|uniref:ATP-binding protein n=1 Tax=Helicobacter saguini TaxID=1548018 RepID=A0A347VSL6_9HELI|nr:ATP-binding protein [Helicobacter saguini]MWV62450.1 hypothetical protein [Helicobacter saguini]MWV66877.1 hypothetical protein [Helicobacter saguini]MWV69226.1 hypothetical protein [Helicobacter saguini]MWV71219.1 hypothetical protein [Helicobacter saguini]TLD93307.1 ATP-binding protein [Helicobacter saguini]